jgi:hypothetical protein
MFPRLFRERERGERKRVSFFVWCGEKEEKEEKGVPQKPSWKSQLGVE